MSGERERALREALERIAGMGGALASAGDVARAALEASEDGTGRGTPLVTGTVRSHMRPSSNETESRLDELLGLELAA